MKRYWYRNLCSVFIVCMLTLFLFHLRYDIPLYGDDVGGLTINDPNNHYLDEVVAQGECTLNLDHSLNATWNRVKSAYFLWDGRIIAKFAMIPVLACLSLPDGINWLLYSIYITSLQLCLFGITVFVVAEGGGKHKIRIGRLMPLLLLLIAVLLFYNPSYSYAYMTRILMWTFTNIYVISVILYLCLYALLRYVMEHMCVPRIGSIISVNILGFLAGLSHEAYGVIFGMVLLVQLARFILRDHPTKLLRWLFLYAGYLVGFGICFFAPGNFHRASQSHEAALQTIPLLERMTNSFYIHIYIAYRLWIVPVVAVPILVIGIAVLLKKRILTWKDIFGAVCNNLEWPLGFAMSAVTWGLVARVAVYGMLAANAMLIIGVIRILGELYSATQQNITALTGRYDPYIWNAMAGLSVAAVLILAGINWQQIASVHRTADIWRTSIAQARASGAAEVEVPRYPDGLNYKFYESTINEGYDKISSRVVYQTAIRVN